MSKRRNVHVSTATPSKSLPSPNGQVPFITVDLRVFWPNAATEAEVLAALEAAIVQLHGRLDEEIFADAEDDLGSLRWFGESWGAPICDPRAHVRTPAGWNCERCRQIIGTFDRGVTVPVASVEPGDPPRTAYHLHCWLTEVAGPMADQILGEMER